MKVNLKEKLSLFYDHWNPRIIGELNEQYVKLAKFKGEFVWHKHDNEDELFYVIEGSLKIEFKDKSVVIDKDEMIIIPRGIEHRPVAEEEVSVMLFEPKATINTGDNPGKYTQKKLKNL